jgi:hypothetical protein
VSFIDTFTGTLNDVANGNVVGAAAHAATNTVAGFALGNISSWVLDGTRDALRGVASAIGTTTAPNLDSTWFSSTYWRVAALAAMLTVPFLCAAALQALARSDMALLTRSVFGYLPLSLIGVSLAAPLTMLLLAATDQMSAAVSATGIDGGARFLDQAATAAADMAGASDGLFFAVLIGLFAIMAALALAVELLVRDAAVYVVVLMLPLAFAAMVWPARRVWATRLVELLVSLILSKFVIVAVLSLAGSALASGGNQLSTLLTAMALVVFATFAPWALMRILPFTEVAASAAGMMRHELPQVTATAGRLGANSIGGAELAMALPARLRRQAHDVEGGFADQDPGSVSETSQASGRFERVPPSGSASEPAAPEWVSAPDQHDSIDNGAEPQEQQSAAEPGSPGFRQHAGGSEPQADTSAAAAPLQSTKMPGEGQAGPSRTNQDGRGPDHDPRGPFQLPAMWKTGSELRDDLPEIRLGPEFAAGPFDVDPTAAPPVEEERE